MNFKICRIKPNKILLKHYFSYLISQFSSREGYTLIELLVVITILGIIGTISVASFVGYNDNQITQTSVQNVKEVYIQARSKALSQIKPAVCTDVLNGYQVVINQSNAYEMDVVCGGQKYTVMTKTLPRDVSFDATATQKVFFNVTTAAANTGDITIVGKGKSAKIHIDPSGKISVQ